MDTETRTIRLRKDQISSIKELNINLSEWVRNKVDEEMISLQEIKVSIKNTQKKLEKLKEIEKNIIQCNTENSSHNQVNDQNKEFLLETKVLLEKDPTFVNGRIQLFKNRFGITRNITKKSFLELLKEL